MNIIINGSILCWAHFNLLGEYDFSEKSAKNSYFNMEQILELKVA